MRKKIAVPGLVLGLLSLVVCAATIFILVSTFTGNSEKDAGRVKSLPVMAGSQAAVPTGGKCQTATERNFDCFLLNTNESALIAQNNLGTRFDLVQSVGEYSVHLRQGYADGTSIVLALEIDAPEGFNFMAVPPHLTDEQGNEFTNPGEGSSPYTKGQTGIVYTYARSDSDSTSQIKELGLNFVIPSISPYPMPDVMGRMGITPTPGSTPIQPPESIPGPFIFKFSLPVKEDKVIEPRQVVKTPGYGEITLEKVVVTPLEIRAYIKGVPLDTVLEASVNRWNSTTEPAGTGRSSMKQNDGSVEFILRTSPPADKLSGQWTLALRPASQLPFGQAVTAPQSQSQPEGTAIPAEPATTRAGNPAAPVPPTPLGAELTAFPAPTPLPIIATFQFNL